MEKSIGLNKITNRKEQLLAQMRQAVLKIQELSHALEQAKSQLTAVQGAIAALDEILNGGEEYGKEEKPSEPPQGETEEETRV